MKALNSAHGALAELMDYTHAGLASEEAEQIRAFIRSCHQQWQQQGYTRQATRHREEFSREAQNQHIEQIILSCL